MGVRITLAPSVSNTSSNGPENFASRSRSRNLAEQEPDVPELFLDREVPRLLRDPRGVGVCTRADHVHPPGRKLDEEQDVDRPQPERLDGEEVAGQDPLRL